MLHGGECSWCVRSAAAVEGLSRCRSEAVYNLHALLSVLQHIVPGRGGDVCCTEYRPRAKSHIGRLDMINKLSASFELSDVVQTLFFFRGYMRAKATFGYDPQQFFFFFQDEFCAQDDKKNAASRTT